VHLQNVTYSQVDAMQQLAFENLLSRTHSQSIGAACRGEPWDYREYCGDHFLYDEAFFGIGLCGFSFCARFSTQMRRRQTKNRTFAAPQFSANLQLGYTQ
jgi:hypothetical protein